MKFSTDNTVKVFTDNGGVYTSCNAVQAYFSSLSGQKLKHEISIVNKAGQIFVSLNSDGSLTFEKINPHFDEGKDFKQGEDEEITLTRPQFNPNLLPEGVKEFAKDVAYRMDNAPIEFSAITTMLVLSASIGSRVLVRPKQMDTTFSVVPNSWGIIIGPPSIKKTPIYTECLRPLIEAEKKKYIEHEEAVELYKEELRTYKYKLKLSEKELEKKSAVDFPTEPKEPIRTRYTCQDTTVEALTVIMKDNPNGILNTVDELAGFLASLNKVGREGDRAFYLEAFSGKHPKNVDRIGRKSDYIPQVCASIFGTIQPDKLSSLIESTNKGASGGDGLLQRFQFMVMIEKTEFIYVDKVPDLLAEKNYNDLIVMLLESDPIEFGAQWDEQRKEVYFSFSPDASETFQQWTEHNQEKIEYEVDVNVALSSHLGKFNGLFASIALILFYADRVRGYTQETMIADKYALMAWAWCDFLEGHARLIYDIDSMVARKREKLDEKIINKVIELERNGQLPIAYGKLRSRVNGSTAAICRRALKGKVEEDNRGRIKKMKNHY